MTLNISGRLFDLSNPCVMGILNATPDSFFAKSRVEDVAAIKQRALQIVDEGAAIIDVGACSTRPGSSPVSADEELRRLDMAMSAIRSVLPEAVVSIDTFRADVARHMVEDYGVGIINDISGGQWDNKMFETVADLHVPYVLTHLAEEPLPASDSLVADVCRYFEERIQQLHNLGVADIIIDPGFGFGKTLEANYELMHHLADLHILDLPLLVGVSRKSMIHKLLGITADEALTGTIVLNTLALSAGASIFRVHDVREAVETLSVVKAVLDN